MKDLLTRSISGFIYVALLLLAFWLHELLMFVFIQLIGIISLIEFFKLFQKLGFYSLVLPGIFSGFFILSFSFLVATGVLPGVYLLLSLVPVFLVFIVDLFYHPEKISKLFPATLSGLVYIILPLSFFPFLSYYGGTFDYQLIFGFFIILWTYDSFAYLVGVMLGRHKIFPEVSPKKSWEGFFGGLIFAMLAAWLMGVFFEISGNGSWYIIALIIVVMGTLGDFFESALKREAGVKDSGDIMPGHGGALDRLDSVLFSIPFVYIYLALI